MAVISVKIGPGTYKFSCADGQEDHIRELAGQLNSRAEQMIKSMGFMQESQLLAMICLLLAEEKSKLEKETNAEILAQSQQDMADSLQNLALKIESLAENLKS